jgi:4-hydroxyphenylpyruvate dioxygenase-like putative hemolysin
MPRTLPVMHHVVFAVAPERLDAAVQFLESLGFRFHRHELTDVGLQVMLDWDGGVEIVTPTAPDDRNPGSVAEFLAREGDGVYSVVMCVDNADAAEDLARRYGADTQLRQRRDGDGIELLEVQLSTIFGMPLTLLSMNLP